MGFVQADPIRSPARAQDLILRHRVKDYKAGDLERRYAPLEIEEDVFVIYGFVTKSVHELMHPREDRGRGEKGKRATRTKLLLEFVQERGEVHPRQVDEHFAHGTVTNYWGGSSNATTYLLEDMHYRGLLRVARREKGIRIYAVSQREPPTQAGEDAHAPLDAPRGGVDDWGAVTTRNGAGRDGCAPTERIDALVDLVVRIYAPLPSPSLSFIVRQLRYAAPQWREELTSALQRAKQRLSNARVDGVDWYWPVGEDALIHRGLATECRPYKSAPETVRLLAPFDPVVRDRPRFELLWGWEYRFEAYTPAPKRKFGYYALPLLWRDRVIGWGNLSVKNGELQSEFGYVTSQPRDRVFKRELEAEVERMRDFLSLES